MDAMIFATDFTVAMISAAIYNSKQKHKKRLCIFDFIFIGVNPFDSAALGRLIERVADLGFMMQINPKHHFCVISIKKGVPFPKIIKQLLGKTYPAF